ncbi:MAG: Crp/Fnr family transcriptional regulator [Hyphomicrobium sp.]|uniref:Crp/Fnr family transcriptional regulator n=1 Tax=Hyphomicrobium sp. TaxID=82 RepID=UPI0025BD0898|nr:Crp/Fnr family transcriptional regulator [Hyphomicrobium sp.]MBZ0209885.1 Crp/Fnr family transcriptional regulator [Hyphomicrobium sp.]
MLAVSSQPPDRHESNSDTGLVRTRGSTRVRRLARGETLFHSGDKRDQLYRVERGALCHYLRWADGHHEVIEFAFPGDIIGFGHLDVHTSTAQAVAKTIVSPISEDEFEQLLAGDGQLAARYAAAADREFDYLRVRALAGSRSAPAKRVASFLAALSRMGASEGRDPSIIRDEFSSGAVAEHLNMTVDALAGVLRELEARGMVTSVREGLRITDIEALETFADTL